MGDDWRTWRMRTRSGGEILLQAGLAVPPDERVPRLELLWEIDYWLEHEYGALLRVVQAFRPGCVDEHCRSLEQVRPKVAREARELFEYGWVAGRRVHRDHGATPVKEKSDRPLSRPPPPKDHKAEDTWFEARVVDEIGEVVAGASASIVAGGDHHLTTDGAGTVRLDGVQAQYGSVRLDDLDALREALRPRWDLVREGEWIEPEPDVSFHPLRDEPPAHALLAETPHTLVIQPWVIRARLLGTYFDTNKCFLLPAAIDSIRALKKLYDDHPGSSLLVVGHTDTTGDPSINDPLSLERAEAVAAYLTDDVAAWLAWYAPGTPWEKRWGNVEDQRMIAAMPDFATRPAAEDPVRWFQRTRGLTVDGVAGPQTRTAVVRDYMGLDGTTLPPGTSLTTHGCGESFPLYGDTDDEAAKQLDRRVELYFFDGHMGVQPPPPGRVSAPGSREYPEWVRRSRKTHDFQLLRAEPFVVGFFIGVDYPDSDGDFVLVCGEDEVARRPLAEADSIRDGYAYFELDPDLLPARITAYWDKGDDALLVLDETSPAEVSTALSIGATARAAELAFGGSAA